MRYLSVAEIAKKWNMSERSVRNYCAKGRVNGAFLTGKTWNLPENAEKPERINKRKEEPITLLDILKEQKASKYSGGIYHKTQIDLTYNSNHMEGSRLTHDQTRYIFETNMIGVENEVLNVDDVIETANHFCCIDMIIDHAKMTLTEKFIINPKGTSISKLSKAKKSFTVKWKKQNTQTTGYRLIYSMNSKFKTGNKYVMITSNKTTSKSIKKLKAKKKYYIRICTYKTVGGTKYYSGWSSVKSVTTK